MSEEELKPGQKMLMEEVTEEEKSKSDEKEGTQSSDATKDEEKNQDTEEKGQKTPYKGRFKQFGTVEEFEDSYSESFKESKRLVSRIQDLEEKLKGIEDSDDEKAPKTSESKALEEKISQLESRLSAQELSRNAEDERQYNEFVEQHAELKDLKEDDPLIEELVEELRFVAQKAQKKGRHLSMNEGLTQAWKRVNSQKDNQESELEGAKKVVAKDLAAAPAPSGAPSQKSSTTSLTEDEKRIAKMYGLTNEQYLESKK